MTDVKYIFVFKFYEVNSKNRPRCILENPSEYFILTDKLNSCF